MSRVEGPTRAPMRQPDLGRCKVDARRRRVEAHEACAAARSERMANSVPPCPRNNPEIA